MKGSIRDVWNWGEHIFISYSITKWTAQILSGSLFNIILCEMFFCAFLLKKFHLYIKYKNNNFIHQQWFFNYISFSVQTASNWNVFYKVAFCRIVFISFIPYLIFFPCNFTQPMGNSWMHKVILTFSWLIWICEWRNVVWAIFSFCFSIKKLFRATPKIYLLANIQNYTSFG